MIMHCQKFLLILILSSVCQLKADSDLTSIATENFYAKTESSISNLISNAAKSPDPLDDVATVGPIDSISSTTTSLHKDTPSPKSDQTEMLNSTTSTPLLKESQSNSSITRSILDYFSGSTSTTTTTTTTLPDLTNINSTTTTTTTTTEATTETTSEPTTSESLIIEDNKDEIKNEQENGCVFFRLMPINNRNIKIEPNSRSNFFNSNCFKSEHLGDLNDKERRFEKFFFIGNRTKYSSLNFSDNSNILTFELESESTNSFTLTLSWSQLNSTMTFSNYGALLVIYENFESIGKLYITGPMVVNQKNGIIFSNLKNATTYSVSLGMIDYFNEETEAYLQKNVKVYESDNHILVIKNVYQEIEQIKRESSAQQQTLNSNGTILIYAIASLLLLGIVCALLYYRRNKFKSLIGHHCSDKHSSYPTAKYLRQKQNGNTPTINISSFDTLFTNNNGGNSHLSFEHQFLKNTAQLNSGDRVGAFHYKNDNRDKLSLNKCGIGRVLEHSVATIKKRTALKMINPSVDEIDLKKMDSSSKYSQPVSLIDFLPSVHELTKSNTQRLFNEFMQLNILSNGATIKKSIKVARNSKNLSKNKDNFILPYDHSRVVLEMNQFLNSDYINASFIPGMNSDKEYIACQNPLKNTIYSFWLMCLQQNVKYIVMATKLNDAYATMEKYYPDTFSEHAECVKQIENITIKLRDKRKYQYFILRIFEVKMNDEVKVIKHYQLTDWSEKENDQNLNMITSFIEMFREEIGVNENCLNNSPIVVHCSNGVGKTAIFIAVDRVYVQLKKGKSDHIDIFKTVLELRQYRPMMIQSESQYKFIYECVGQLIRKLYPTLVKQMEFDRELDEINLNDKTDFDANNNLDSSYNSQKSLFNILKTSGRQPENNQLNGYTNHTFINDSNQIGVVEKSSL